MMIIFPINGFEYTYTRFGDITLNSNIEFLNFWANTDVCDTINQTLLTDLNIDPEMRTRSDLWTFKLINLTDSLDINIVKINKLLTEHNIPPIKAIDLIDMDKFNNIKPESTGLPTILNGINELEIMIKGSYYAFNFNFYANKIKEKLQS